MIALIAGCAVHKPDKIVDGHYRIRGIVKDVVVGGSPNRNHAITVYFTDGRVITLRNDLAVKGPPPIFHIGKLQEIVYKYNTGYIQEVNLMSSGTAHEIELTKEPIRLE
jgi:hypothetical protein